MDWPFRALPLFRCFWGHPRAAGGHYKGTGRPTEPQINSPGAPIYYLESSLIGETGVAAVLHRKITSGLYRKTRPKLDRGERIRALHRD